MKEQAPPLVPVLAALPVCACMAILGLPALGNSNATAFRALFFAACMLWILPLALMQRALWRREVSWRVAAPLLLAASYAMSVVNAVLGQRLAIGLGLEKGYHWNELVRGLDGCWLALIAFCAIHALAVYYLSLQRTQLRLAQALAHARDAELRALRLQVNPHFLFNSLNAVSALVAAGANRDANCMLSSVSDFLRATLSHDGRHEHALAEELALTEAYLDIEKARLGERLQLAMKAGPDLLDAAVPYLVLQPLAENAIRHGIAPLSTPGRLDIRVERAGAGLLVEVVNDGVPPKDTAASKGGGIGLANVAERLRHLYGADQQLEAGWRADGRFQVRLTLPLRPVAPAAGVAAPAERMAA
ncbi:sensor histidine kinase [Herbaspirillum sp. SJZ107]|uniref:sensor histidine kinase n=1 Tax=Herbaspirillum sp. SJZ107 TaxID=2572881 RepID=UPI00116937AE|nr:histidine kinase [Herbaspirillum sp. SJZ107]TQK02719.1 two-component system sensor histidine kinase AlgZ [Herbaspirillum sp. SJZ107]